MLETVKAGQTRRGVILQQVSYTLDKPRRDGRFKEGIDIFRRDLERIEGMKTATNSKWMPTNLLECES